MDVSGQKDGELLSLLSPYSELCLKAALLPSGLASCMSL